MKLIKKNKVISTILAVAIALSMILGPAIDSQAAGWKNNSNGWWYENSDGSYPTNEWKNLNGTWYYFDASGYMVTGWEKISGLWYFFEDNGAMATGWKNAAGVWYYLDADGTMTTGWKNVSGTWYYMDGNGAMVTGWKQLGNYWYYFKGSGAMASNEWVGNYYLDASGAWKSDASANSGNSGGATGWVEKNGKWYFYDSNGAPHNGWVSSGSDWYYTDADGSVHTGWLQYGSDWYYMDSEGKMQTGWVENGKYLMGTDGKWISDTSKIIYLTFDDGPGPYTDKLLSTLDKYNVKATFFVTNAYPGYASCIKKAYNSGHTIGVHTYTHNYNTIYASDTAYWNDFEKMEDVIVAQTGSRTNIFRFPGGSSNTVSNFNSGIMTKLTSQANTKGYKYFDWNVSSEDAAGATTSTAVYNNIVAGVKSHNQSVVLCHDIKSYTVDAMDDFISWALANGYTFLPITESTPTVHHTVQN